MPNLFDFDEIPIKKTLVEKYMERPFSIINSFQKRWHRRKDHWRSLGIISEVGRDNNLTGLSGMNAKNGYNVSKHHNGTSVFDPVLCELMYRWFCPDTGRIIDPFAGGSVRGIVANYLGYNYTGIELRQEQVDSNRNQAIEILPINRQPQWYVGDSDIVIDGMNAGYDMFFTCPPYMDLEKYSDDISDLSGMNDDEFIEKYGSIIKKCCLLLKKNAFAVIVVGDVRDKKTGFYKDLIGITKKAFRDAGYGLYNEAIYIESGYHSANMRAEKYFHSSRKLVKIHQNILVFKKSEK